MLFARTHAPTRARTGAGGEGKRARDSLRRGCGMQTHARPAPAHSRWRAWAGGEGNQLAARTGGLYRRHTRTGLPAHPRARARREPGEG
jgi:hypothetical protein